MSVVFQSLAFRVEPANGVDGVLTAAVLGVLTAAVVLNLTSPTRSYPVYLRRAPPQSAPWCGAVVAPKRREARLLERATQERRQLSYITPAPPTPQR